MRQISWGSEESEGRDLEKLWKILQEGNWLKGEMVTEGEIVKEWRKEIEGWRRGGAFPLIE